MVAVEFVSNSFWKGLLLHCNTFGFCTLSCSPIAWYFTHCDPHERCSGSSKVPFHIYWIKIRSYSFFQLQQQHLHLPTSPPPAPTNNIISMVRLVIKQTAASNPINNIYIHFSIDLWMRIVYNHAYIIHTHTHTLSVEYSNSPHG